MSHGIRAVVSAGIICGVLDGLSAIAVLGLFGSTPTRIFQGIASGVLGSNAFSGGMFGVGVGVVAHFIVSLAAASVYYGLSRSWPSLNEHAIRSGVLFGIAVHLFMNFVVIPLSAIGVRPIVWPVFLSVLVVHMVVVGPSISLTVRRMSR